MQHFNGYNYISLAYKKMGKRMEPYIIECAFGEKAVFSHDGEEFMYVLEGTQGFVYARKNISWGKKTASILIPGFLIMIGVLGRRGQRS